MILSREQAIELIDEAEQRILDWEASDDKSLFVDFRYGTIKAMSQSVKEAFDAICALTTLKDVADDACQIIIQADRVHDEFHAWQEAINAAPEAITPAGSAELWSAWRGIRHVAKHRPKTLPEPMLQLIESGVSDQQIGLIYGFLRPDGTVDTVKVQQEKAKPGTHYNPETWLSPAEVREHAEHRKRWEKRPRTGDDYVPLDERETTRAIAPESIEELLAINVSSDQIARMKGITKEEVIETARELGLLVDGRIPPGRPEPGSPTARARDKNRLENYGKSHPEIENRDERIVACIEDGMTPSEIAELMAIDYPDLTFQKVSAIGKQWREPAKA